MKKSDYAKLYTLRSDGRYQGCYYDDLGNRHFVCDRDPEALHKKIEAKKKPPAPTFKDAADRWEVEHVEQLARSTQATYNAPLAAAVERMGSRESSEKSEGFSLENTVFSRPPGADSAETPVHKSTFWSIEKHKIDGRNDGRKAAGTRPAAFLFLSFLRDSAEIKRNHRCDDHHHVVRRDRTAQRQHHKDGRDREGHKRFDFKQRRKIFQKCFHVSTASFNCS